MHLPEVTLGQVWSHDHHELPHLVEAIGRGLLPSVDLPGANPFPERQSHSGQKGEEHESESMGVAYNGALDRRLP